MAKQAEIEARKRAEEEKRKAAEPDAKDEEMRDVDTIKPDDVEEPSA